MLISPPFLPATGLTSADATAIDPMMDEVDKYELVHGIYPIAFDRRWHTGMHLYPDNQNLEVRAIADGEVVAYRLSQKPVSDGAKKSDGTPELNSNNGFVLLKHTAETGEGRTLTFYSLYMHLMDLDEQNSRGIGYPSAHPLRYDPPLWPQCPSDAPVAGNNLKVRRKDILGYAGKCHAMSHLHFEIFMTKADFDAYFSRTQLGHEAVVTPATTDVWGRTYYVIPAHQQFLAQPPGTDAHHKLHGIEFSLLKAGQNASTLYVETCFHKDGKYTRVWQDAGNGKRDLLTDSPIYESKYDWDLFERAKALYPTCPSDGYELLRFGRILSTPATLAAPSLSTTALSARQSGPVQANPRATWVRVAFARGHEGYIDIGADAILKVSDADFPSFMGWKKISEGSSPFDGDGLCDFEQLRAILGDVQNHPNAQEQSEREGYEREDALVRYVRTTPGVRDMLRSFVCEAPSEWDGRNNEARYARLKNQGEFYHGNDTGYAKFMEMLKSFQFWDKTGLPAGQKLWFFHPLYFIRHMRRCGWLSADEIAKTMPKFPFYGQQNGMRVALVTGGVNTMRVEAVRCNQAPYVVHLNRTIRKYGLDSLQRKAMFLAQINWETAQWRNLPNRPIMHEWGYGAYNSNAPATQYYAAFYGRGAMQLTWAKNYADYQDFCGPRLLPAHVGPYDDHLSPQHPRITSTSRHWTVAPADYGTQIQWAPRYDPNIIARDPMHACNSAGFYWVSRPFQAGININRKADQPWSASTIQDVNRGVNGGGNGAAERLAYSAFAARFLLDVVDNQNPQVIATSGGAVRVDFSEME
jgi:predicted chitinase